MATNSITEDRLALAHGYVAERGASHKSLRLRAPDGTVAMTLRLTPDGPQLIVPGGLEVVAEGDLRFDCERFDVNARAGMTLQTGGDLDHIGHRVHVEGNEVAIAARRGDLQLDATEGDVDVNGSKVLLNSPKE